MGADRASIFKAHLGLHVERMPDGDAKLVHLKRLIREAGANAATVVFAHDTATALRVRHALTGLCAVSVTHAGQTPSERLAQRQMFLAGDTAVLVSASCQQEVGRLDVRLVVHHDSPSSLEVYHRQIMEAGLDGRPSLAVLFSDSDDPKVPRRHRSPALDHLLAFTRTRGCRWRLLQEHLGDDVAFTRCGTCDNCRRLDADTEAAVRGFTGGTVERPATRREAPDQTRWPKHLDPGPAAIVTSGLRQGLAVAVDRHGWGWVQRVDETLVSVDFPDGHSGRFTPALVHPLSQHALDFAARLLPAQVSALRHHEDDHLDIGLTYHQLLGRDRPTYSARHARGPLLGPSDSSDSGSDVGWWDNDFGNVDVEQDFSTDASGTGERWGVESNGMRREAFDIAPDRIVDSPNEGFADTWRSNLPMDAEIADGDSV